jgi:hypothetical protein
MKKQSIQNLGMKRIGMGNNGVVLCCTSTNTVVLKSYLILLITVNNFMLCDLCCVCAFGSHWELRNRVHEASNNVRSTD